jgi:hypothetical protein
VVSTGVALPIGSAQSEPAVVDVARRAAALLLPPSEGSVTVAADQGVDVRAAIVEQAIGVLRGRRGCSADEAFSILRQMSVTDRVPLAMIAESIVNAAVRRAQAANSER